MFDAVAIPEGYAADPVGYYRGVRARLFDHPGEPRQAALPPPPARPSPPPEVPPENVVGLAGPQLTDWSDLRLTELLDYASTVSGVPKPLICSRARYGRVMRARRLYYWAARKAGKRSFQEIGRVVRVDHTSVLHGARTMQKHIDDRKIAEPLFDPQIARACRARYLATLGVVS
jgi:hypothetical protein